MLSSLKRKNVFIFAIIFFSFSQVSCSSITSTLAFWESSNSFESLKIVVDQKANQNSAIAVDLVFAYDNTLIDQLGKINAKSWFQGKSNFRLNFPTGFDVVSWELVPGQKAPEKPYPAHMEDATGIFIFANYSTQNGLHRARIDQLKNIILNLGELDFTIRS